MTELKTQAVNFRMAPSVKELLRLAAQSERRTLSNMLEVLILDYCEHHGIKADDMGQKQVSQETSEKPE